jgi:hypothetical protein
MYKLHVGLEVDHPVAVAELEDSGRVLLLVKTMATSVGVSTWPPPADPAPGTNPRRRSWDTHQFRGRCWTGSPCRPRSETVVSNP